MSGTHAGLLWSAWDKGAAGCEFGPLQVWVQPSEEAEAQWWASAMHGEFEREVRSYGRGERGRATLAHLRSGPRFVLENVTLAARSWPLIERKAG